MESKNINSLDPFSNRDIQNLEKIQFKHDLESHHKEYINGNVTSYTLEQCKEYFKNKKYD